MSITVTDPILLAQLTTRAEVELKDPSGKVLGMFVPEGLGKLPSGVKSPFSEQEMADRRKAPKVGRHLVDILLDLEKHMRYEVLWDARAEADLTSIWLAARSRHEVTRAVTWFDNQLARLPLKLGESRASSTHRVAFYSPLGIEFEVIEDDKRVVVQGVFAAV